MRWIWIDRILELEKRKRCVAIKNISLAEDVLHDHFPASQGRPARPVLPNTLIIEGMAQTGGILVGHANDFAEKVVLAKISKACFHAVAEPGFGLRFEARIDRIDQAGAATSGNVQRIDPATGEDTPLAEIDLMFSHLDLNLSGLEFPEHNFVFTTDRFRDLMHQSGFPLPSDGP